MSPYSYSDSSSDDDDVLPSRPHFSYRTDRGLGHRQSLSSTGYGRPNPVAWPPATAAFPFARDIRLSPSVDRFSDFPPSYPSLEWHWSLYAIHRQEEHEDLSTYLDRSITAARDLELGARGAEQTAVKHIARGLLPEIKRLEEVFDVALLSHQMTLEEFKEEMLLATGELHLPVRTLAAARKPQPPRTPASPRQPPPTWTPAPART